MRILIIAPTPFFSHRGCHIRIFEEARALLERGHSVEVVTYHIGEDLPDISIKRIPNFFWYQEKGTHVTWHKLYFDFFLLLRAFYSLLRFRPHVLHCHLHEGALIGIILRLITRKPMVFDSQGSLVAELKELKAINQNSFSYRLFLWIEKFIYWLSPIILVSNEANRVELITSFKVPERKVKLLEDGISIADCKVSKSTAQRFRKEIRVPPSKKVIIFVGGLYQKKGVGDIIELAYELAKKRDDLFWIIRGFPYVTWYQEEVNKKHLQSVVHVGGKIPYTDLWSLFSIAHFAISLKPPTVEGSGKLLHYAQAGLPVICYDQLSNRSILGEHAFYLSFNSSMEENASHVSDYLDLEPEIHKESVKAMQEMVLHTYEWKQIIKELEHIYGGLI